MTKSKMWLNHHNKIKGVFMVINWLIMGYFLILFIERGQSLVRSFSDKNVSMWGSGFDRYVNGICILSLAMFLILLFTGNRDFLKSLFVQGIEVNIIMLCITIGVILIAGMVHTEHTISGIQFASYGLLIAALIIRTAKNNESSGNSLLLWLSLVYLIFFSMAIPVVYKSAIRNAGLFHVIEAVVSFILVAIFAYMAYRVFSNNAVNLFMVAPILMAVMGDAIVLGLRWKEHVNYFVLIFLVASVITWIFGFIIGHNMR